ncbi:LysR family transcriptional regulator [Sodalis sp. RH21]|uniref:LysR family transcriptional regulator n=1 Tax=unclassified Sodalis (in: enterobacteria) TaxID=2636512 RepID=UPI0039B3B83D
MHFDLIDLRLLVLIIETGTITAGADKACLSLSSASARIGGLEKAAGVRLLERGRRGVTATPAGRVMYQHAKLILRQIASLAGELNEFTQGLTGYIRLLANTVAMGQFLPGPLSGFLHLYPGVDIELAEMPSVAITRAVAQGHAELGIAADHADFTGLEVLPFKSDRLVLAVPRGHALARRKNLTFSEALDYDFIGLPTDSALQQHLAAHAVRAGKPMRLRARVSGLENVYRMVTLGAGIAVLPLSLLVAGQDHGAGVVIPLREAWTERQLMLTLRRYDDLSPPAKRLVDFLTADSS